MRDFIRGAIVGLGLFLGLFVAANAADKALPVPSIEFCQKHDGLVGDKVLHGAAAMGFKLIPVSPQLDAGFLAKLKIARPTPHEVLVVVFWNEGQKYGMVGLFMKNGCTAPGTKAVGPFTFEELRDALVAARVHH